MRPATARDRGAPPGAPCSSLQTGGAQGGAREMAHRFTLPLGNQDMTRDQEFVQCEINRAMNELEEKTGKLIAIAQLYQEHRPTYVEAIFGTSAGRPSECQERPYQWLWENRSFGTLLYNYLRGRNGKKHLIMSDVCGKWLDRLGEPMNFNSIKTMHANENLPDTLPEALAERLDAAGFPYTPPDARIRRAHAIKLFRNDNHR